MSPHHTHQSDVALLPTALSAEARRPAGAPEVDPSAAFVALTRSGARHVVDPARGTCRRTHEGRTREFCLVAVVGEVGVGCPLVLLVTTDANRVVAVRTGPVEYLAQLHPRPALRAA